MGDSKNFERRLSAMAFADVAGWSRLISADAAEAISQWRRVRLEVITPRIEEHGGRLVEMAGDAVLVEFTSVVSAVQWALDVQGSVEDSYADASGMKLQLRVAVNIDEVIVDDGILQGEGVNIAARIHQAAVPGQIVVTEAVRDYVATKLPVAFKFLGEQQFKNVAQRVRVFAVERSREAGERLASQPYLNWSSRPTLAVLPFRNIGHSDDSYFGEGMTEDIITGLSRSRSLYVVSRNSTLRYRERNVDIREIANDLDVRYVLDGSVRRQSNRLRINAELIQVDAKRSMWAERFDGANDDIFDFQDRIVSSIVGAIEPRLREMEAARVVDRPTDSLDAYDCVLKALAKLYLFTEDSFNETGALIDRAIELTGVCAGTCYRAWRINFVIGEGRSKDLTSDIERALDASQRAISLDSGDPFALCVAGHVLSFMAKRPSEAVDLFDQALALNQNSAFGWGLSALTFSYLGRSDEAVERLRNVWRLSPYDPMNFYFWIVAGIAEFVAGRYGEAIAWLKRSRRANPRFTPALRMLAASCALSGDTTTAHEVSQVLLRVDPRFRISSFLASYPLQRREDVQRLEKGLQEAGLPQ